MPWEDRRDPVSPRLLHRRQNPQLVIDQHIVVGGISPHHVVELLLLVDINEDVAVDGFLQPRALDLAGLKDRIAVREDHRRSPGVEALEHIE